MLLFLRPVYLMLRIVPSQLRVFTSPYDFPKKFKSHKPHCIVIRQLKPRETIAMRDPTAVISTIFTIGPSYLRILASSLWMDVSRLQYLHGLLR